jgi:hypothetical protein
MPLPHRAGVCVLQPGSEAGLVKQVLAGHLGHVLP